MPKQQTIHCKVNSCRFHNHQLCTLQDIMVDESRSQDQETYCSSYRNAQE